MDLNRPPARALRALRALRTVVAAGHGAFDPDRLDARDPQLIADLLPATRAFCQNYLRLRVEGTEHLGRAPALYVANHNGGVAGPDLACTLGTLWESLGPDEVRGKDDAELPVDLSEYHVEMNRRRDEYLRDPASAVDWDVVRRRLEKPK